MKLTPTSNDRNRCWQWQLQHCLKTEEDLQNFFPDKDLGLQEGFQEAVELFPFSITPYYASLIQECSLNDPIWAMMIPHAEESISYTHLKNDPYEEKNLMPVPRLIQRYPNRVLLEVTGLCASYCRYCTRKRITGSLGAISNTEMEGVLNYLKQNRAIKDILLSGGDPLTLETKKLDAILTPLRKLKHLEVIRIGSKVPVSLPMRIDDELCKMLLNHAPLWLNTHFNHPAELTKEAIEACRKLHLAGVALNNQSVMLEGVNDSEETLTELFTNLVKNGIRPYYHFMCDLVDGTEHFRTDIDKSIHMVVAIQEKLSGMALPHFVVDTHDGGGKIPLTEKRILERTKEGVKLQGFQGKTTFYPAKNRRGI